MPLKNYIKGESLKRMVTAAEKDSDRASMFVFGADFRSAEGCVLVVKGHDETVWLREMLIKQRLLTPGKSVSSGNPSPDKPKG